MRRIRETRISSVFVVTRIPSHRWKRLTTEDPDEMAEGWLHCEIGFFPKTEREQPPIMNTEFAGEEQKKVEKRPGKEFSECTWLVYSFLKIALITSAHRRRGPRDSRAPRSRACGQEEGRFSGLRFGLCSDLRQRHPNFQGGTLGFVLCRREMKEPKRT